MEVKDYIMHGLRRIIRSVFRKKFYNPECEMNRQVANDIIYNTLSSGGPCMISRFGTTEMNCINNYLCIYSEKPYVLKIFDYLFDWTHLPWWNKDHFKMMSLWSGVFPPSVETAEKFSEIYLNDIPLIDVLGSFQYQEKFMPLKENVIKLQLETLYPFFVERPWTRILKNKKVLVIHPFEETIVSQYRKRKCLFQNEDILPEFDLIVIKAVQSVADTSVPFKSWFEALEYMKRRIDDVNFDICLLGCGAYGLPLAAYIKRKGKQAIHLGGGLQLLFGIKGKRWIEQYDEWWNVRPGQRININYRPLFNDSWVFPSDNEKPAGAKKVEDGCYW